MNFQPGERVCQRKSLKKVRVLQRPAPKASSAAKQ
jgi:hypothetical protein